MNTRAVTCLAWSLWTLSAALVTLSVPFLVLNLPTGDDAYSTYWLNLVVASLAFSTVGALIASRRRENPIGWLLVSTGLLFGVTVFGGEYSTYALLTDPGLLPGGAVMGWLVSWLWHPSGTLILFSFLFFPRGRLPSPRWRVVAWLAASGICLETISLALMPGPLKDFPMVSNPLGIEGGAGLLELAGTVSIPLLWINTLAPVVALFLRFRRARGEERQQIKWVAYAAAVLSGVFVTVTIRPDLDGSIVGGVLFLVGLLAIPISIGIAILRYRLYDIDLIINRTLVYGLLTATLALVYVGGVVLLQGLFRTLAGETSQLAVVVSTLVIAALFSPLRRRIQAFIDRRFYRRKYDAEKTLQAFSARLRDEVELDALSEDLLRVVRETVQPAHVSFWLRPPERVEARRGSEFDE